jgi:hypothetical protein
MHVEWVENEALVLDPATHQIHYLNPSAALFYGLVLEHGFEEGTSELREIVGEMDEEDFAFLVDGLVERGLLRDE